MLLRCSHCDLISLDFLWIQWIAYTIGEVNRVLLPKQAKIKGRFIFWNWKALSFIEPQ